MASIPHWHCKTQLLPPSSYTNFLQLSHPCSRPNSAERERLGASGGGGGRRPGGITAVDRLGRPLTLDTAGTTHSRGSECTEKRCRRCVRRDSQALYGTQRAPYCTHLWAIRLCMATMAPFFHVFASSSHNHHVYCVTKDSIQAHSSLLHFKPWLTTH